MFYADLHLHSKYSRATSRESDLEHMAIWARKKGVSVIATGDFTHPEWFAEIKEKLVPAEPGLFQLRDDLQREVDEYVAGACAGVTRFLLQVEISTIYKKADRTRKVHHVIYVPDFEKAETFIDKLSVIGNLKSDGRPILGLDSRDLLEITLECGDGCYLVPAHIWTPWFAVLGSKSGFDSVDECYADLASHIFALETGLSSDPPMNWRLSQLDRYTLVSNSDAHSPAKIAREACVFETQMDYFAMRRALETGDGYAGTVELFPEEGKYHLDGHRKCGVRLWPGETSQHNGLCPECGKPVTVGVMHRVDELSDRPLGFLPQDADKCRSLVPLPEVIAEIRGVGEKSKKVQQAYEQLIARIGPELHILERVPIEDIRNAGAPRVAEAIRRMREGSVIRDAGYDGEYGTIHLFEREELAQGDCVSLLFDISEAPTKHPEPPHAVADTPPPALTDPPPRPLAAPLPRPVADSPHPILNGLDADQRKAAETILGPLLIVAGPGTGKTRTLTHRIAHLIADHDVPPERCLAITFSRRAAAELNERLTQLLAENAKGVSTMTFHALGLTIVRENAERLGLPTAFRVAGDSERLQLLVEKLDLSERQAKQCLSEISRTKRASQSADPSTDGGRVFERYQQLMQDQGWVDFDDLILLAAVLLETSPDLAMLYRRRWHWISVDEYQDMDDNQFRLLQQLAPPDGNLCVIGDPDQSIYGFRGSNPEMFLQFVDDYPTAKTVHLTKNYRSSQTIVAAAVQAISPTSLVADRRLHASSQNAQRIQIETCPTERAEAEYVVHTIERLIGGSTFFSMDSNRVETEDGQSLSFDDFAVLYRTEAQTDVLVEAFARSGMPFQKKSHRSLVDEPAVQAMTRIVQEQLHQWADEAGRQDTVTFLAEAADAVQAEYPDAAEHVALLRPLAERWRGDPARFLSELALGIDVDLWDPRADRVSLLTLHAAKGLEFPVVFLVGCEDGLLPLHWGSPDDTDVAEERRLFFVGMTRAREWLYLSHANKRRRRGRVRELPVSPFLQEIQEELLERTRRKLGQKSKKPADTQLELF